MINSLDAAGVAHIAALAKLKPDAEELIELTAHLNRMVEYCALIDEVDTSNIEPLHHVFDSVKILREDVAMDSAVQPADVLAGAPERSDSFFRFLN